MSNLVYLMTSLPSLTFGQVSPISMDEFNREAKNQLSAKHFKRLELVDIQKLDATKGGIKKIALLLSDLKQDLSEIRKAKAQNRQPKPERLPKTVIVGDPLVREEQIMKWQWEELDTIEAGKTFTLTEVMVYKLKLQIIHRLLSFDKEKGTRVLASVVNPLKNKEDK